MNKKTVKRLLCSCIGIVLIATGVPFFVKGNVGTDSVTVLYSALTNRVGLTIGRWTFIIGVIECVVVYFTDKKKLGFTTITYVLLSQFIIDFINGLIPLQTNIITGTIFALLGIILMSLGCVFTLCSNLGLSIYDAFCFSITDHFKLKYVYVRYVIDGIHLVLGLILGGKVGIGTILAFTIFGFTINILKKWLTKPINRFINK